MNVPRFHSHTLSLQQLSSIKQDLCYKSTGWCFNSVKLLTLLSFVVMLSACSDDNTPFGDQNNSYESREIVFSVKTASVWNNGSDTRSNSSPTSESSKPVYQAEGHDILTLKSAQSKDLYLIPEIIDGIYATTGNTRSSLVNNGNIESFGVFASLHPDSSSSSDTFKPDYMYNVEITKENDWTPADEYLWPGKAYLHINAYSPFCSQISLNGSEGITSLPALDDSGNLSLSWSTPSEVADQIDLMWATPANASASPCELIFNHALTAIKFVTGSEMAPCTIKTIQLTNIIASGSLNLETGEWDLPATTESARDFSVSPGIDLSAEDGGQFVAAGSSLTSDDQTFLLLPQTLSESSQIILTIEINGSEHIFSASLNGQSWTAGKTVIYRLSANPSSDSMILQILDANGNPVEVIQSHYTGTPLNFSVASHHVTTVDGQASIVNVPWKAEFIDDNGNVIERPQWITEFPMEGDGDASYSEPTVLQEPTFTAMSDDTRTLRSAADINSTSGFTPYNLSNSTGASGVENTANCYVISAPGKYSLPLVYGNAIKNSVANTSAYQWNTHTKNVLKDFLNHLGKGISDPYIYNNSGCEPNDAYLVWEGRLCLIENVALSEDKHSLIFEVPALYIRQGDALLAVRDKDGNIMWSWQIWVTPHRPDEDLRTFTYNGHQYQLMAHNIGELSGGDITSFEAQSVKIRFTQVTDDATQPKSVVIDINRDPKDVETPFTYSYFQWGRKDPMISLIKEWYTADHEEITNLKTQPYADRPTDIDFVSACIRTPNTFWTSSHDVNEPSYDYINLWNVRSTDKNGVKSIYDPSPIGFMVPGDMFSAFNNDSYQHTYNGSISYYPRLVYTLDDGELVLPLLGYRSSNDGKEAVSLTLAPLWMNGATLKEAHNIPFQDGSFTQKNMTRAMGYGIRPMKEP